MRRAEIRANGARVLMIFLISACLFLFAIPTLASSPDQQCPTAPVQQIAVPVYSICGCKIGVIYRAPKRGEAGFRQCQCSAKRSAQAYSSGSSKPTLFTPKAEDLPVAARPKVIVVRELLVPDPAFTSSEPLIPPPNQAQV